MCVSVSWSCFSLSFVCTILLACLLSSSLFPFFFFKQKTAYELRISDWSSDVCSSDLRLHRGFRDFQIDSACRHTLVSRHRRERDGHVSPHEAAVFPVPHLCLECRPGEVVADEGNRIGKGGPSVSRERQPSSIEHVFLRWLRERGFPIDR